MTPPAHTEAGRIPNPRIHRRQPRTAADVCGRRISARIGLNFKVAEEGVAWVNPKIFLYFEVVSSFYRSLVLVLNRRSQGCSNDGVGAAGDLDRRQAEVGDSDLNKDFGAGDFLALGHDDGVHPERGLALVRRHPELRVDHATSGGGGAFDLGGNWELQRGRGLGAVSGTVRDAAARQR